MPTWTPLVTDIHQTLTLKVRVLTLTQIALGWFGDASATAEAEAAMQPLCELGLIEQRVVSADPLVSLSPPAFHWSPGDPHPTEEQIQSLVEFFQGRWNQPDQSYTVYVATREGASLAGSHILDPPDTDQWPHDIHVAELFVQLKQTNSPEEMRFVVGEGALPKLGRVIKRFKDPDLFFVDEHGQAQMVLEFAGKYDQKHVQDLHNHCSGEAHRALVKRFPNREHRLYPDPRGTEYLLY